MIFLTSWTGGLFDSFSTAVSDALNNVQETVADAVFDRFIPWAFNGLFDALSEFLTNINEMGAEIFDLDWCKLLLQFFAVFGGAMFVVGFFVSIFDFGIANASLQQKGDVTDVIKNGIKGFVASFLFVNIPVELYRFCISLQNSLSKGILMIAGKDSTLKIGEYAQQVLMGWRAGLNASNLFFLGLLIVFAYCIVKVFFANLKRGGILIALIAIGSIHMFSVPRGYTDGFTAWCKQVIGLCVTALLQTTLLYAGLITFAEHPLLGTGVMLAATEVPRVLEKFGLETSARFNPMQGLYGASMAMSMVRVIK